MIMAVMSVLLAGVACVLLGILYFRLHAMVALLLGALLVGLLTPQAWRVRYELQKRHLSWQPADPNPSSQTTSATAGKMTGSPSRSGFRLPPGARALGAGELLLLVRCEDSVEPLLVGEGILIGSDAEGMWLGRWQKLSETPRENDWLIRAADWRLVQQEARRSLGQRMADAFGQTCGSIAVVIAMASIIGRAMQDSGAADVIVRAFLRWFGQSRAALAFLGSGFLLGIPVFFDTVFYLMMPLGRALRARTGRDLLLYTLAIVAGATMAHSLVPPTPGPLFVARQLDVDLGLMILAGSLVGLVAALAGYLFALWSNQRYDLPLRDVHGSGSVEASTGEPVGPPLFWALLPVVLPVLLISFETIRESFGWQVGGTLAHLLQTLGDQNIALLLAAAIAVGLVLWKRRCRLADLRPALESAVTSAGSIILITAAGGTFGAMIRQTGIADWMRVTPGSTSTWLIVAFLVTMAIRTAQGSATVSMITSVGIFSGLATAENLGFHPVYLALAIGCGSKPLAWMNDSGFWVICQMSGMTEREALRFITPMSLLMGVAGLMATILGAWWFPLLHPK
ncbi:MAG: hypothetical protein KatS3mg110_1508 [Pirellulaceae bacterium]|nr:MAG: hypothetical protein KatS3mg110_1508 [Pirellulaceae bacterium]